MFSQQHRSIQIASADFETSDFMPLEVEFGEALTDLYCGHLTLFSETPKDDIKKLIGKSITMTLIPTFGIGKPRHFHGFITELTCRTTEVLSYTFYQLQIRPWLWYLSLSSDYRRYEQQSAITTLHQVADRNGFARLLKLDLQKNYPNIPYLVQYNENDMDFFQRMVAENGLYYYFEHTDKQHKLVLTDHFDRFIDPKALPFQFEPTDKLHIRNLETEYTTNLKTIAASDYNPEDPQYRLTGVYKTDNPDTHDRHIQKFEHYQYPGNFQKPDQINQSLKQQSRNVFACEAVANGESNHADLSPGYRFDIVESPTDDDNDNYLIERVIHHAKEYTYLPEELLDQVDLKDTDDRKRLYNNQFQALIYDKNTQPKVHYKRAEAIGLDSAQVLGPGPGQLNADELGRVKTRYHWQHDDENTLQAHRVRSVQATAGKGRGMQFIPREGQEVAITYLNNDPNQPIIIGSHYNSTHPTFHDLPKDQAKMSLTTRSTGSHKRKHSHEITFDDAKGKETLSIHSARDTKISAKGDWQREVGNNATQQVGGNYTINTGGEHHIQAKEKMTLNGGGSQIIMTPDSITFTAKQMTIEAPEGVVHVDTGSPSQAAILANVNNAASQPDQSNFQTTQENDPTHWIQAKYTDDDGNPMQGLAYEIQHTNGQVYRGKLDANGQTEKIENLNPGSATITFGEKEKLEREADQQREILKQNLDAILAKVRAEAKAEHDRYKPELSFTNQLQYNNAVEIAGVKSLGKGAVGATVGAAKAAWSGVVFLFNATEFSAKTAYHAVTFDDGALKEDGQTIRNKVHAITESVKKGAKLVKRIYRDKKTQAILVSFAKDYYDSETPMMLSSQVSHFIGGMVPAIIAAVILKNPSALSAAALGKTSQELNAASNAALKLIKLNEEIEKCATLPNRPLNQLHKHEYKPHPDAKSPKVGEQIYKREHPDGHPSDPYTLMEDGKPMGSKVGKMPASLYGLPDLPINYEKLLAEGYPDLNVEYQSGRFAKDYANFKNIEPVKLKPGTKIYRIVDENSKDAGPYWSFEKPKDKPAWRSDFAVKDSWNDNGYYVEHTVGPEGLKAWQGETAGQAYEYYEGKDFYLEGGKKQLFITPGGISTTPAKLTGWKE